MISFDVRLQNKRDQYDAWATSDPVLLDGEIVIVTTPSNTADEHPVVKMKSGDGVSKWSELPWVSAPASNVAEWALASEKPTYSIAEIMGIEDISLPSSDASDEGKFLRVVDGSPTWAITAESSGVLDMMHRLLAKAVYTEDVSDQLAVLDALLDGDDTGDDTGGDDTGGGGSDEPVVTTEVLTFVHSSSRYPDLTTFAYTQVESGGYPLVLPSTIGGGVLSVDFDTSRFVNFQIVMYLFDENGAPYKLIGGGGKKFTGNMDSSGWVEKNPGTAPGWATVAGPFTMNIPDGCNVMMAFQPTGGSSADGSITQTGFNAEVMDNGFIQAKITKEG